MDILELELPKGYPKIQLNSDWSNLIIVFNKNIVMKGEIEFKATWRNGYAEDCKSLNINFPNTQKAPLGSVNPVLIGFFYS